jgi:hypothetical protein
MFACSNYTSTLKMEAVCPTETFSIFNRTILRHIPGDISYENCYMSLYFITRQTERVGVEVNFYICVREVLDSNL